MYLYQLSLYQAKDAYRIAVLCMILKMLSKACVDVPKCIQIARNTFFKSHQLSESNPIEEINKHIIIPLFGNEYEEVFKPYIEVVDSPSSKRKLLFQNENDSSNDKRLVQSEPCERLYKYVELKRKISAQLITHHPKMAVKREKPHRSKRACDQNGILDKLKRPSSVISSYKDIETASDESCATPVKLRLPMNEMEPASRILAFGTPSKE